MVSEDRLAQPLGQTLLKCNGSNISLFDPPVPQCRVTPTASGGVQVDQIAAVTNVFTSEIIIPPAPNSDGFWRSDIKSWTFLNELARRLPRQGIFRPQISYLLGTVRLIPKPSALQFYNHILYHERQHVADNRWAVTVAFQPWQNWLDKLHRDQQTFTFKDRDNIPWFLGGGVQPTYYGKHLFDVCNELGGHYHKETDEGAAPIYSVTGVCDGAGFSDGDLVLKVEVSAKKLLTAMAWNSSPHQWFEIGDVLGYSQGAFDKVLRMERASSQALATPALAQSDIDNRENPAEEVGLPEGFF